MSISSTTPIAWVLRSSTIGFVVGCQVLNPDTPRFGEFVKVSVTETLQVMGVVYDVRVNDDPSVRQLILAGDLEPALILDQRQNRLVPIELSVLTVGYAEDGNLVQNLPPQPPISLDALHRCTPTEVVEFTTHLDYLRLILRVGQIPTDELIIANLTQIANHYAPERRRDFLLTAAREITKQMSNDLLRLDGILRQLRYLADF
ncbi:MAG: hypothetical protein AAF629_10405 [Chloroflexota bacterium]